MQINTAISAAGADSKLAQAASIILEGDTVLRNSFEAAQMQVQLGACRQPILAVENPARISLQVKQLEVLQLSIGA